MKQISKLYTLALLLTLGMASGTNAASLTPAGVSAGALSSGLATKQANLNIFNVKAAPYNATGNGTTDDTTAIQSAINAAQTAGGGVVFFPEGTYLFSAISVTAGGITLEGVGETRLGGTGTTLLASGTTGNAISIGSFSSASTISGCNVSKMTVTAQTAHTSGALFAISGIVECDLEDCDILAVGVMDAVRWGATTAGAASSTIITGISYMSHCNVYVQGGNGLSFYGGNDRYISDCWIAGTSVTGSNAVLLVNTQGDWFTDDECVTCQYGFRALPASGNDVWWTHCENVLCDTNVNDGFALDGTNGSIEGIDLSSCWGSSNGSSAGGHTPIISGEGLFVNNVKALDVTSFRGIDNGGSGIYIQSCNDFVMSGGLLTGNSQATSGATNGLTLVAVNGATITGVRSGPIANQGNTQGYGILVNGNTACTNITITGCDDQGNINSGISGQSADATHVFTGNL